MATTMEVATPAELTEDEKNALRQALEELEPYLDHTGVSLNLSVDKAHLQIPLPVTALGLIARLLSDLSAGKTVTIQVLEDQMTTQEAADFLQVSRPFLIGLVDKGELSCYWVGNQRRLKKAEVLGYRARRDARSEAALREMIAHDQELGLYD